ncbi:MAG: sulfite exporter TauE/SafE family protein, partial [Hyphomicrobium sp.]
LRDIGQFDLFVALSYVTFLGAIGALMMIESVGTIRKARSGQPISTRKRGQHSWVHGLPFKMRFHRSKLYISVVPPALIGAFVGFMAAVMGIGGGFVMVPAMIYLLRVPTNVVVGTSLFQIVFVMAVTTVLQAVQNQTVDVVLALLLIIGGVIGAQLGAAAGGRLKGEQLRFLLAALVILMCLRIGWDLVARPDELYSITPILGVAK